MTDFFEQYERKQLETLEKSNLFLPEGEKKFYNSYQHRYFVLGVNTFRGEVFYLLELIDKTFYSYYGEHRTKQSACDHAEKLFNAYVDDKPIYEVTSLRDVESSCSLCGASVKYSQQPRHDDFHRSLR